MGLNFLILISLQAVRAEDNPIKDLFNDKETTISIEGMTCMSCVATIKKEINKIVGIQKIDISLPKQEAKILYVPAKVNIKTIIEKIKKMGYQSELKEQK